MVARTKGAVMKSRTAARGAGAVCALTLLLISGAVMLDVLNPGDVQATVFAVVVAVCALVGGLVASRRPANVVGWYFLGSAACLAGDMFTQEYATYGLVTVPGALPLAWVMAWVSAWLEVLGAMLLFAFVPLFFPNGRLVSPRWHWPAWFALCFSIITAVYAAFTPGEIRNSGLVNPLGIEALPSTGSLLDRVIFLIFLAIIGASATSLLFRFRRSRGEERQQLKWLAYAAAAIPVWFLTNWWIEAINPVLFSVLDALILMGVPVAAGIAILKYRLYDIDVIINRTLVYSALTVTLALVYVGSVFGLQRVLAPLIGPDSDVATIASTLAIAALFNPLRRRIQAFIDRRFYRRKYDAAKTLEAFSMRLRNETDLDAISNDLLAVVEETLQPAHVSLWLREPPVQAQGQRGEGNSA
jgi:hypothetical protein